MSLLDRLPGRNRSADAAAGRSAGFDYSLTTAERESWDRDGYLVLRQCIRPAEVSVTADGVGRQWIEPGGNDHVIDVLTGEQQNQAIMLRDADPAIRGQAYKLDKLFAHIPEVRQVALGSRLKAVCTELLEDEPMVCNSLNFKRGSRQMYHIDPWYMPPPVDGRMVAATISLDDVDENNGP